MPNSKQSYVSIRPSGSDHLIFMCVCVGWWGGGVQEDYLSPGYFFLHLSEPGFFMRYSPGFFSSNINYENNTKKMLRSSWMVTDRWLQG